MAKEGKKCTARKMRNFYLYPYRSKGENLIRGVVWMLSWLVGIFAQEAVSKQALGGAYLIFSLSLLLEFLPESKEYLWPKIVQGIFYILLLVMLLGSLLLSFWNSPTAQAKESLPYKLFIAPLPCVGWIIFAMMALSTVLSLLEVHKYIYDEEAERQSEMKAEQEAEAEQFYGNLKGVKGGNAR